MVWAEIHMDDILGSNRGEISRPRAKKLQISNRAATTRFNKIFMAQINNHRLLERARELEEEIGQNRTMTKRQEKTYKKIIQEQ